MRVSRDGVIAAVVWLAAGVAWEVAGGDWRVVGWFVIVGGASVFVSGLANHVTLARAYLAGPCFYFAVRGEFAAVAVVVALAGLSDLVDGTIARRFGSPTQLGGGLDPVVDGLFMGALCVGLGIGGTIPLWLAVVVIARYVLPALVGGLLLALGRRPELRHTLTGQVSTTLILVLVGGVCLLRGLNQDPSGLLAGAEVVIPIATVATYLHLGWATFRRPAGFAEAG